MTNVRTQYREAYAPRTISKALLRDGTGRVGLSVLSPDVGYSYSRMTNVRTQYREAYAPRTISEECLGDGTGRVGLSVLSPDVGHSRIGISSVSSVAPPYAAL